MELEGFTKARRFRVEGSGLRGPKTLNTKTPSTLDSAMNLEAVSNRRQTSTRSLMGVFSKIQFYSAVLNYTDLGIWDP